MHYYYTVPLTMSIEAICSIRMREYAEKFLEEWELELRQNETATVTIFMMRQSSSTVTL